MHGIGILHDCLYIILHVTSQFVHTLFKCITANTSSLSYVAIKPLKNVLCEERIRLGLYVAFWSRRMQFKQ